MLSLRIVNLLLALLPRAKPGWWFMVTLPMDAKLPITGLSMFIDVGNQHF